ncbi:MAG: DMT family transporter [Halobacteriovoraceae bacterium]|nr:DMT family transporter [Halobacteriovoraceae bacterium]
MNNKTSGVLLLTLATMIWGLGFVGTRWTLYEYSATWSHGLRYLLCVPLVIPYLLYKKSFHFHKNYLKPGISLGFLLFLGLWTQTVGIAYTTVAKAGFFTVFYAFFTPIIGIFHKGERYRLAYWGLLIMAMFGIALLCELKIENFNFGDVIVLLSAFIFSFHIYFTGEFANQVESSIELNVMQTLFVAIFSVILAYTLEGMPKIEPLFRFQDIGMPTPITGFIIVSFFSTLIAFSIQIVAQRKIRAHIASLVFLMESVFAAFFGYVFLNEGLSTLSMVGGFLVLLSVFLVPYTLK